jgi:enolase
VSCAFEIEVIHARQILDSRGNPTLEVEVALAGGATGRAAVPSGASTGENEAVELRDGDKKRWLGKGVEKAVGQRQREDRPELVGMDARDQEAIDADHRPRRHGEQIQPRRERDARRVDGRRPCRRQRDRAAALSLPRRNRREGAARAHAEHLNGGKHADNTVDFQEFMIQPWGFDDFGEALRAGVEIYHTLKKVLHEKGMSTAVGDEGGFAPDLKDNEDALRVIAEATEKAGYKLGEQIFHRPRPRHERTRRRSEEEGQGRVLLLLQQPRSHRHKR